MLVMLGIPNCDTVRKAQKYLDAQGVGYVFRDLRKEPLAENEWRQLLASDTDGVLINTRSPSFRKTGFKSAELTEDTRLQVLMEAPTAMKRPALMRDGQLLSVGYNESFFLGLK